MAIDWAQAKQLWRDGLDTYDIAIHFKVHESVIYNGLNGAWARRDKPDDVRAYGSQEVQLGTGVAGVI